jgi:hypothetical protein
MLRRCLTLAAALCCFFISPAAFAQDPELDIGAQVIGTPNTVAWADTSQGLSLDEQRAKDVATQFTSADLGFFKDNTFVIGKNAQPVLVLAYVVNADTTFFLYHRREPTYQVDGSAFRDPETKEGFAEFYLTTVAEDGKSSSTVFVQARLKWLR